MPLQAAVPRSSRSSSVSPLARHYTRDDRYSPDVMASIAGPAASLVTPLPHWDMTPVFPGIASAEFESAYAAVLADVGTLGDLFDQHGVRRRDAAAVDDATIAAYEAVTGRLNALLDDLDTIFSYLYAFVSTNSRDDLAQAKTSA